MRFLATFGHWINDEEPAVGPLTPNDLRDLSFEVEAPSRGEAEAIAKKYEGLETHAYEGIGSLKSLVEISEDITRFSPISIYEDYLPENRSRNEARLREVIRNLLRTE